MEELLEDLQQINNLILLGAPINKDIHECACLLSPHVCALKDPTAPQLSLNVHGCDTGGPESCEHADAMVPCKHVGCAIQNSQPFSQREIILLQLTLIRNITAKAQSQDTGASTRSQYFEILQTLFRQEEVDCQLISLLGSSDKLLSHLAAKCLSCLVLFLLKEENTLSESWLTFCLKALSDYPCSGAASQCMWSLTVVTKDFLDDPCLHSSESMKNILAPLDTVFEGFYSSVLSPYAETNKLGTSPDTKADIHLSTLMDLLEVLVASRFALKSHYVSQRILFQHAKESLALLSSTVPYYIVKKLVLLLKKVMLWKLGESFACGTAASSVLQDPYLTADHLQLANEVLETLNSGLLMQVPVKKIANYFGGCEASYEEEPQTVPDLVQLGGLCLTLLKALETKVQVGGSGDALIQGEFQSFMSGLLKFIKRHLPSLCFLHPCEWVSLVFIEQDDDMLEAAKALLAVYVKSNRLCHRSSNATDPTEAGSSWTHDAGCNPHCIFLLLLKNIAFDATVLLDFLISSETCFLEYFVRYLKFLREDWQEFCHVCTNIIDDEAFKVRPVSEEVYSIQEEHICNPVNITGIDIISSKDQATPLVTDYPSFTARQSGKDDLPELNQSSFRTKTDPPSVLGLVRGLVDYDSSEDSEQEMEANLVRNSVGYSNSETTAGVCADLGAELDRLDLESTNANPKDSDNPLVSQDVAPATSEGTLSKSTQCLRELQSAVSRLQRRNLFPYNASALLKLLMSIETLHGAGEPQLSNKMTI